MSKFVLIDGNAILHRAYHAMPELTSPQGELVNAVYGFFAMFLTILAEQQPKYLAVCFDRSKPTIRQTMYAGYHAHRPQMADGLSGQIAYVDAFLDGMKVPTFALDGYEGDDLIGTLATKAARINTNTTNNQFQMSNDEEIKNWKFDIRNLPLDIIIVSGDRDMLQLVNPHTFVWMPIVGLTKSKLYGERDVEEKYGVHPSQFVDYKALIGDPSDGYPGVTGIGPKTAAGLLQKYGTFEALYERIEELPEKIGLKLATDAEQAALAKKLAKIICDAPFTPDFSLCDSKNFDLVSLRESFFRFGFKSLAARLENRYPEIKELVKKKEKEDKGQMGLL